MRYVVTTGPQQMEVREGPAPVPADGEALIRVEVVGLCGSDYHLFDGTHPYSRFPQVQGHELVGLVEELPARYGGPLAVGQRVAVEPLVNCRKCFACRRGRYNCCTELKVMGAHLPGGLAELIAVAANRLHPTGDLRAEVAVLTEPVTIGLQCVHRAAVAADDRVVVIGAGPIGQAATLGAVDRGARVLVADKEGSRLTHARRLGAHRVVDTTVEDLVAATAEFTDGEGAAVVIEATGVPALIRSSVDLVAHSGTVVVVGISTADVALPVTDFSRKELNLLGARNNTGLFPEAADLVARHADRLAPLVTHVFGLADTPNAIAYARAHPNEVEKVVIRVAH